MDLNQLLFHHQVALIRDTARNLGPAASRFDLAGYYERRIGRLRREMGVLAYPAPLLPSAA
jgi:hypothetical protein